MGRLRVSQSDDSAIEPVWCGEAPPDSLLLLSVDFLVKGVHDAVELVHFGVNLLVDVVDFLVQRVELSMQRVDFLVFSGQGNPSPGDGPLGLQCSLNC